MKNYVNYLWCDKWFLDGNEAWLIPCEYNAMFHCMLDRKIIELIDRFPDSEICSFRRNHYCLKYENEIYCMPDNGDSIFIYHLNSLQFSKITVKNEHKNRLHMSDSWCVEGKIYSVSAGLKQIIELSPKDKKILEYYNISDDKNEAIEKSIMVNTCIFILTSNPNRIYQFDINSKNFSIFNITKARIRLSNICYDGKRFWLGGYGKAIYLWNIEENILKEIELFLNDFGIFNISDKNKTRKVEFNKILFEYNVPAFQEMIVIGKLIWLIPFTTNKILYIDKDTYELNVMNIEEEEETIESFSKCSRRNPRKYFLEYIRSERYIGLYSHKLECYCEIDTVKKEINYINYSISEMSKNKLIDWYKQSKMHQIYYEISYLDRHIFGTDLMKNRVDNNDTNYIKLGKKIYDSLY